MPADEIGRHRRTFPAYSNHTTSIIFDPVPFRLQRWMDEAMSVILQPEFHHFLAAVDAGYARGANLPI